MLFLHTICISMLFVIIMLFLPMQIFCSLRFQYGPPFRFAQALMRKAKFSITRRHVSVVMLWVNDSTACFSCLREQGFSLYTSALAAPSKKKSKGARSGLCGDHSSSACKLQILFPSNVRKWAIVACAIWGVAPSCWNHSDFWFGVYSWLRSH